ncbi:MAG: HEAT repeat domain-containing protein [Pseudomonas sp.]
MFAQRISLMLALCLSLSACDAGDSEQSSISTASAPSEVTAEDNVAVAAPAAESRPQVMYLRGQVSIIATDTPQLVLLAQLAKQAGFGLELFHRDWKSVTLSLSNVSVETALSSILADAPYQVSYRSAVNGVSRQIARVRVGTRDQTDPAKALAKALTEKNNKNFNARPSLEVATSMDQVLSMSDPVKVDFLAHLTPSAENLPVLVDILKNYKDTEVRIAAMASLENAEAPQALNAIIEVLDDPDPQIVLAAIDSIEFAGSTEQIFALEPLLQHPSPVVQIAASEAIDFLR